MTKKTRGIGFQNALPWSIKEDMEWFKKITTQPYEKNSKNTVIMGRNTWESLPKRFRPLPDRDNIVLSNYLKSPSDLGLTEPHHLFTSSVSLSMSHALNNSRNMKNFVIGGAKVYESAIVRPECEELYLTIIDEEKYPDGTGSVIECDTFFPKVPGYFKKVSSTPGKTPGVTFEVWKNVSDPDSPEQQYLYLLNDILANGESRGDRTGTGVRSVFGRQLRFPIASKNPEDPYEITLPLLTTKKVYFKGVVEELLFFLRGDHDNRKLQAKGVHIWDGNTSREYLDKYGKTQIQEHDLGLAYGVQVKIFHFPLEKSLATNIFYSGVQLEQSLKT